MTLFLLESAPPQIDHKHILIGFLALDGEWTPALWMFLYCARSVKRI